MSGNERSLPTATHDVLNQPPPLIDYDVFSTDRVLGEALEREGGAWAREQAAHVGRIAGGDAMEWGRLANVNPPVLKSHDRYGHRIDEVEFHPAWHALMDAAVSNELHALPWHTPRAGAHVARAAFFFTLAQAEAGHGCPISMTYSVVPALRAQADVAAEWEPRVLSTEYDPRSRPASEKRGALFGMAMTEKQGGSDVRANTTRAYPLGGEGAGEPYELVGHKFFVSAPMCDAFLVLAQANAGLSCFLVPRWRPDGSKNPLQIVRLKRKMGNVSNASSETELRGALGWMLGEPGHGVRTIIEMVAMTRFDCMIGSSAGQRAAVAQALHHCSLRKAFGALLVDQPLMRNVLADLVLENEGSLALTMRVARALDRRGDDAHEELFARIATPVGKYWICKRTPGHAYEAMECIGGSGVMEDSPMPRLFRESPINAIWEGSGNVQCLDVLRAMGRTPQVTGALFAELARTRGANARLDRAVAALHGELADRDGAEVRARAIVEKIALALQASLLVESAPTAVADAFCASRLEGAGARNFGTLPRGVDCGAIVERAMPHA